MTADVDDGGRAGEGRGMRLLHTADWHLGRALHGALLLEDQVHLLDQFVDLVRDERPWVVEVVKPHLEG